MVTLIASAIAASPSPTPSAIPAIPSDLDMASLIQNVLGIISGVTKSPILALSAVGGIGVILLVLYLFLKAKYDAWVINSAKQATDADEQNFVDVNSGTNTTNTNTDNTGRNDLNKLP